MASEKWSGDDFWRHNHPRTSYWRLSTKELQCRILTENANRKHKERLHANPDFRYLCEDAFDGKSLKVPNQVEAYKNQHVLDWAKIADEHFRGYDIRARMIVETK